MPDLNKLLEAHGLTRLAEILGSIAQPSLRLQATKPTEAAVSRLGGQPNLPSTIDWPAHGEWPLAFIAQIDLSILPEIPSLPLPRTGALYFFYDGEAWGYDPKEDDMCRVFYSAEALSSQHIQPFPRNIEYRYIGMGLQSNLIEQTIPHPHDTLLDPADIHGADQRAYFDLLRRWNEDRPEVIHRMGGFPDCVQSDPKLKAQLVSHDIYCGDSRGYDLGERRGLFPGAADWVLLLQVDSEEAAEMMWGDMGRLYFLIKKDDLAALRFDQTRLVLQCG